MELFAHDKDLVQQGDRKRKLPSYIEPREPSIDRRYRPCPTRKVNLDRVIQESSDEEPEGITDAIDLTEDEFASNEPNEDNTIAVFLRLRPHPLSDNTKYEVRNNALVVHCEETTNHFKKELSEKHFSFTKVFSNSVSQHELYENCIRSQLNDVTTGTGSTFLTYGTSGSGKTHTLLGDETDPGIVPRSFVQLFGQNGSFISQRPMAKIHRRIDEINILPDETAEKELSISNFITSQIEIPPDYYENIQQIIQEQHLFEQNTDPNIQSMNIWVSFVEIYNENVRDLLDFETHTQNLRIIANDGESFIRDVQWVFAPSARDCHAILKYGLERASYGTTAINDYSSRAHSIFYINVVTITKQQEVTFSNYKFCDLAGSERVKKAETVGDRLKETQRINKSLMSLGRCLTAVHANQKAKRVVDVVPVRDSKLTLLIQSALTGKERLVMIVNLLPINEYYDENMNVLSFSTIAKQINIRKPETRIKKRQSFSFSMNAFTSERKVDHIECELEKERLQDEVELYKEELNNLKSQMYNQEVQIRDQIVSSYEELLSKRQTDYQRKLEIAKESVKRTYEARITNLNQKYQELQEDYEESTDQNENLENENKSLKEKIKQLMEQMKAAN